MYKNLLIGLISFAVAVVLPFCGLLNVPVYAEEEILYVYDDAGRVVSATYPDGTVVTYHYDSNGNLVETETTAGYHDNHEETQEVLTEDDTVIVAESSISPNPTSDVEIGNVPTKKQTTSVPEDTTGSESNHQKKDEDAVVDDSTTEEQDDIDEESHKGIGKWIALAALGGTAVVAAVGVSVAAIRTKTHKR